MPSDDPPETVFAEDLPGDGEARMIVRKTAAELEKMRRSGLLVWQILQKLKEMVVEGVSTLDLEVAAEKMIARRGREAGVQGLLRAGGRVEVYQFVLCTSVNEEIVHGMPSRSGS